jgi:hypothetical protein
VPATTNLRMAFEAEPLLLSGEQGLKQREMRLIAV